MLNGNPSRLNSSVRLSKNLLLIPIVKPISFRMEQGNLQAVLFSSCLLTDGMWQQVPLIPVFFDQRKTSGFLIARPKSPPASEPARMMDRDCVAALFSRSERTGSRARLPNQVRQPHTVIGIAQQQEARQVRQPGFERLHAGQMTDRILRQRKRPAAHQRK